MDGQQEQERNMAAYRRLKDAIKQAYPSGWFVGVAEDQVVAAAADFRDLVRLLRVLVVEVGVDYPEYVTIYSREPWSAAA